MTVTDHSLNLENATYKDTPEVEVLAREKHIESGLYVSYMDVADISDHSPYKEKQEVQAIIANLDQQLRQNLDWQAPQVVDGELDRTSLNPVSAWLYGENFPCLTEWRESVPSASALSNLYLPQETHLPGNINDGDGLFNGTEIDTTTHSFFLNGLDCIAIRTRAQLMKMIASRTISKDEAKTHWVSLACGAAIPVFETLGDSHADVRLDLVDVDPDALEFAKRFALKHSLVEGEDFTLFNRHLVRDLIVTDKLVAELGENEADMVDMMGIFEYFKPEPAAVMLKNAFRLVKPGGVLVLANMLSTRPQLDFNLRGVGWPYIKPRSLEEISEIILGAGLSLDDAEVYIPKDGIYAVVEIRK
ncbi:class I SAM-dependent methyltransferase [Candidatus Saccharibacteria bacterium]|nr:class I SAM-dependent methyltransferase [Candidatus Saccharibacteria bacterium]